MPTRTPSEYRIFRRVNAQVERDFLAKLLESNPEIYVALPDRTATSRKDAIRDQARDADTDGVTYAAVAKHELTEHTPRKTVRYE